MLTSMLPFGAFFTKQKENALYGSMSVRLWWYTSVGQIF